MSCFAVCLARVLLIFPGHYGPLEGLSCSPDEAPAAAALTGSGGQDAGSITLVMAKACPFCLLLIDDRGAFGVVAPLCYHVLQAGTASHGERRLEGSPRGV